MTVLAVLAIFTAGGVVCMSFFFGGWFAFARLVHRPTMRRADEQHCAEVAALNRKIDKMDALAGKIEKLERERSQSEG